MSRYETRYLTWQYFSLSGIRLATGTWAFLSFRPSRSPWCLPFYLYVQENRVVIWAPVVPNITLNIEPLLNHHFLLAGIYSAFQILRRNRDYVFPVRQGRREIVERAIVADDRHFSAVHHHARSRLGLALHFDHVSVLHKRIDVERHLGFFLRLDNDRKAVLFAFHRYLARRIVGLDGPIIGANGETGHNHALGLNLTVQQQ